MRLSEKMANNKALVAIRKFLMSKTFMFIQCLIAATFVILRGKKDITMLVYGDIVLTGIISLILVICDDIMTTTLPFLLICSISIKCYNSFNVFIKYIYLAPVIVVAVLFHFIVYRKKFDFGKTWPGALAVAVAVTLGGVGIITAPEYFSGTAMFYTIGLGFGMLGLYFLMNSHFTFDDRYSVTKRFSFIMTLVGLFCVFMIGHHYVLYWTNFMAKHSPLYFQWRNNVSTILLLTMPFPFYLSRKNYAYFFASLLEYIGIMFTGSRGGAISGTIEIALCLIVMVYCDKRNRKKTLILVGSVMFVVVTLFLPQLIDFFQPLLARLAQGDDIREGLIRRAVQDFRSNPIFGRGLGYNGNADIHSAPKFAITWYHSSPFQIIGSFGLLGVAAYFFQFYNRMKVIFKRITNFNLLLFVGYVGLFLMSLVNPGEFCPIPYGMMATLFFILCDKNNIAAHEAQLKNQQQDEEEQEIKIL